MAAELKQDIAFETRIAKHSSLPEGHELWLGKAAPRYTSYPPATSFNEDMTVAQYRQAVEAIPAQEAFSLYLHVPYCKKLCHYCACNTQPTMNHDVLSNYLHIMHREINNLSSLSASAEQRKISKLHFGGGSPNMMSEKDIGLMMGELSQRFNFGSAREISMELDPRLVTVAQAKVLKMVGITRISLGAQDFNPDVQKAIGRIQSFAQVARACFELREAGIKNINLDLMYGLPKQTPETIIDTAELAVALKPDRIALFSYAHVPQVKKHQHSLEKHGIPSLAESLALEQAARHILLESGYVAIGMDHFALPTDPMAMSLARGALRRTFQGYTDDTATHLLGLGASSISQTGDYFFQNARDAGEYRDLISREGFAVIRGLKKAEGDNFRAALIEKLMCNMEVDVEAIAAEHGQELSSLNNSLRALAPFEMAGVVERSGYVIKLSIQSRMAVRVVASLFDIYPRDEFTPVSRVV